MENNCGAKRSCGAGVPPVEQTSGHPARIWDTKRDASQLMTAVYDRVEYNHLDKSCLKGNETAIPTSPHPNQP
jgi:hypothetical protein